MTRKQRIDALRTSQETERDRERGDDIVRFGPPPSLEIPLKPHREGHEQQADPESEYFGGFDSRDSDHDDGLVWREDRKRRGCAWRACGDYLGCPCRGDFRDPTAKAPTWGRSVDRGRLSPRRWADGPVWGLVDGQMPATYQWLNARGRWPKWRKIPVRRAVGNQVSFPFSLQAVKQAEQKLPVVTPEQDRAEELERLERRLALFEAPTNPNSGPSTSFARGVLREERTEYLSQHIERAIQKTWCSRFKPSKELEAKRFPKLERVKTKLLPKEGPGKAERRIAARDEAERLTEAYLAQGGAIEDCPSEWPARDIEKIVATYESPKRLGRPPIGERAITDAERQRKRYAKLRIVKEPPPLAAEERHARTQPQHQHLSGLDRRGESDDAQSEAAE